MQEDLGGRLRGTIRGEACTRPELKVRNSMRGALRPISTLALTPTLHKGRTPDL